MKRRELRERIFEILFRVEFMNENDMEEQMELFFEDLAEAKPSDVDYIKNKYMAVREKMPMIDIMIDEKSTGWKTSRMGKVELTILRLAVYEMLFDEDVPVTVAINEAVEIAKKYGQDNSGSFVNAILAKREIAQMRCQRFIDVRVRRCPWADGYKSAEQIPPKVWLENGFAAPCSKCSEYFYDGDLVQIGDEYFCKSCSQNHQ